MNSANKTRKHNIVQTSLNIPGTIIFLCFVKATMNNYFATWPGAWTVKYDYSALAECILICCSWLPILNGKIQSDFPNDGGGISPEKGQCGAMQTNR